MQLLAVQKIWDKLRQMLLSVYTSFMDRNTALFLQYKYLTSLKQLILKWIDTISSVTHTKLNFAI